MKKNEIKKSEEKATIYFGVIFLLSLILDFTQQETTPIYSWVNGVLVIMIVILLLLGIKQVNGNQKLSKKIQNCKNS